MKGYVILEKGFQYNDEIHSNEGEGGIPVKIFLNKEFASKELYRLEIEKLKSINITDYCYQVDEICHNVDKLTSLCDTLNQKYGKPESRTNWDHIDEYRLNYLASDEESMQYYNLINLQFYEIVESDFDQSDIRESKIDHIIPWT